MLHVINDAIRLFKDKKTWADVQNKAMTSDFSWNNQADKYLELYNK